MEGSGIDALVWAVLDSGVGLVTGVPGYPITDVVERLQGENVVAEWCVNEKVALEMALGSSACGRRGLVVVKHVGMNILADPLLTSTSHTIGAGIVILAGDDPSARGSQNEQDSRYFGLLAEVPVLDPAEPGEAYQALLWAYQLSEKVSTPVIIRTTHRLHTSRGEVTRKPKKPKKTVKLDTSIWLLTMQGKHQKFHLHSYPRMLEWAENCPLNRVEIRGETGVISSGYPTTFLQPLTKQEGISHLHLAMTNPLPRRLVADFIARHRRVLVVEETEPVLECQLDGVLGKLTGHLPYGEIRPQELETAIRNLDLGGIQRDVETLESRGGPRPLCPDCPYTELYNVLKKTGVPVAGDMGCSILTASPPLSLVKTAYSLGGAISTAAGFTTPGIALAGDFGLAHSGINALINSVYHRHNILVIVLQNQVSALTGGQPVPDLTQVVQSLVEDTTILELPEDTQAIQKLVEEKLNKPGVRVILARARCPRYN